MVFEGLCFFSVDQNKGIDYSGGGMNSAMHNGYVKDCSSLGADVVPEGGIVMPSLSIKKPADTMSLWGAGKKKISKTNTGKGFYGRMI
eukprot:CAMPEP_0173381260 /NCGR_PEP_ID=MMETSP1356-20130122/3670_1 /TAXON_ID=77927 ORGANISM="Hemiselmis virescens, Strain PCC157" /NCGR_SAMPLE_ID=MMETSP1356 /ASSEMBLY_ACC=CAM_ASM_000847 /LENGTH=87 /DNA_ID=CAMNT_0014335023 /DNA_START=14 /DNA_END=277 /DNA_ORIENTATION=+